MRYRKPPYPAPPATVGVVEINLPKTVYGTRPRNPRSNAHRCGPQKTTTGQQFSYESHTMSFFLSLRYTKFATNFFLSAPNPPSTSTASF